MVTLDWPLKLILFSSLLVCSFSERSGAFRRSAGRSRIFHHSSKVVACGHQPSGWTNTSETMRLFSTQLSTSGNKQTPTFKLPVRNLLHSMVFIFIFTTFSIVATSWEWCSEQRICKITIFFLFLLCQSIHLLLSWQLCKPLTFSRWPSWGHSFTSVVNLRDFLASDEAETFACLVHTTRPICQLFKSTEECLFPSCLHPGRSTRDHEMFSFPTTLWSTHFKVWPRWLYFVPIYLYLRTHQCVYKY